MIIRLKPIKKQICSNAWPDKFILCSNQKLIEILKSNPSNKYLYGYPLGQDNGQIKHTFINK